MSDLKLKLPILVVGSWASSLNRPTYCLTWFTLSTLLWSGLCCSVAGTVAAAEIEFNRDVRPILSENCFQCHGPDEEGRQADLRLDQREAAIVAGAIVPESIDESLLWERVSSDDPDVVMPPPSTKKRLSAAEKLVLRQWIEEGAAYQSHWSFEPPRVPAVPQVENTAWPSGPIDHFILWRLEQLGLEPTPRASRERLIRRLSFDLTGLPPTIEEIDDFLADDGEDAYERVVDRLLRSPRFGERMASEWLDVARYSDSYGYQVDRDRRVWPWRDWVINAFNDNMPYDQFLTEQLAGDLLPQATRQQVLATTFNRLHPQKVEGGSTPEEFRIEYVSDRTQTFATATLGLTLECARCHDHKFDPISQREYYQLTAFFDNIDEAGLYSYFTNSVPTPTLLLPSEDQTNQWNSARQAIRDWEADEPETDARFQDWLKAGRQATASEIEKSLPQQLIHVDFETVKAPNRAVDGPFGKAAELTGDDAIGVDTGNFHRSEAFSISLWMKTPDIKQRAVVLHRSRAWTDAASRGYQLLLEEGKLSFSLIHFWPGNALRVKTPMVLEPGQWHHVVVTYDGSSRAAGVTIWLNGKATQSVVVRDNLYKQIRGGGGDKIAIGERFRDRGFSKGQVDELRVFHRRLAKLEVLHLHDGDSLQSVLRAEEDQLTESQVRELAEFYRLAIDEQHAKYRAELQKRRQRAFDLRNGFDEIMVMRETSTPRQTYLLRRGAYDARGEPVAPGTPEVLPPFPADVPRDRLGLARWLTDERHPLTSRVAVNRYWQLIMGEALVRSPEDFGSQGKPPTHPQLLDWLATDFADNGWDLKRLIKQIVMSSTYRQDSQGSDASLRQDPQNLYWSRAARHRWAAEMLRDNALSVSGLLVERVGGPPAKPYEVEASFKPTTRDKGDGLYRRSVYTYWKRTAPAPVMMALDASKREVCRVKRERTESPLQLLVMLNGPQFVEAQRTLAAKAMSVSDQLDQQITHVFRLLTSRAPGEAELTVLRELWQTQRAHYQANPAEAKKVLALDADAEWNDERLHRAALSVVVSTLMAYDECIIRR